MNSALYKTIARPLAPALGVLAALLLYPSILPSIYLLVATPLAALVSYLVFNPADTVKGFVVARKEIFSWTENYPYLGFRIAFNIMEIITFLVYAFGGFLVVACGVFIFVVDKGNRGDGLLILLGGSPILGSGIYILRVLDKSYSKLIGSVTPRKRLSDPYYEPHEHPTRDFWMILVRMLPGICQVAALVYAVAWVINTRAQHLIEGMRMIAVFVVTFARLIHSSQRTILATDAAIGLIISFVVYVKLWELERVEYLIYGTLTGYMVGFIHNLILVLVKHLHKQYNPASLSIS